MERCTWIDDTEPEVREGTVLFTSTSGGKVFWARMELDKARAMAVAVLTAIANADLAEVQDGAIVPLSRKR